MPIATATQTTFTGPSTSSPQIAPPVGVLKLRAPSADEPEYMKELEQNGFAVVKSVLTPEQAEKYVSRAFDWLEGFGLGFDRNDRSTWDAKHLPPHFRGGLYNGLGVGHEQWVWDIRTEPALIEVFAKLWGTEELHCSFDGANLSVPLPKEQVQNSGAPWPHVDQSPLRQFFHCIQGIMNLLPNGPKDGGLMVLEGSFPLYKQFFEEHDHEKPEGGWSIRDSYHFTASQLQWFMDHGCKWKKIECGPGDVILWDSRCIHYGAVPEGSSPRMATYVCYKPASLVEPDQLALKKHAFDNYLNTSHDPSTFRLTENTDKMRATRIAPTQRDLSHRAKQLAGLEAY